ncbi:hypothetical protein F511_40460 [Dorcoceras hygrometricum]|uniref:Uncharacterized protein n=1 Tax=Dorcoceras hygrometricum TaxID=472368 RepID=A0A2Z7BIC1_9LAMI|nr:hypothetical protein F511_40460 [Dorcoceras hygrometricum]
MAAARRRPPPAQRAAHCRTLRAARPAIGNVAACSDSAAGRTLQCHRAHATVPSCARYSATVHTLKGRHPSLGSHTTVGAAADPDPVSRGAAEAAVDLLIRSTTGITPPSSVCTRRADEFVTNGIPCQGDRNKSDHGKRRRAARRGGAWEGGGREGRRGGGGRVIGTSPITASAAERGVEERDAMCSSDSSRQDYPDGGYSKYRCMVALIEARILAAIRSEQLEFQAKIAADLLSLSTQIGDLVDYIRGDDAKKGEGSSSRPQPPPSNVQGQGSGGNPGEGSGPTAVRLTDIADSIREDDRRQMEAERERERQRRIRRLSSGSHRRRRGH